jgi:hypothetical protein
LLQAVPRRVRWFNPPVAAIDEVLPAYDVHEVHSVALAVAPERAVAAALATPVAGDPLVRVLFRLRGLRTTGTISDFVAWMRFEELARGEGEVVFGASGTPWRPGGGIGSFAEPAPGTVRMAFDLRADGRRITTETRVSATDDAARRAFARYWRVVGPFSALIRRRWLARIAREVR